MGRLTDLDRFGTLVEDWLWQAVRAQLRPPDAPQPADPLDEEADLHERFMESRLRVYVGRDQLNDDLHAFAKGGDEVPCLLVGPSGSGKSAALAHFVQTFRRRHPDAVVLAHFVGASATTTALPALLGRLCHELKRHFGFALPVPDAPAERVTAFLGLLASVPEGRRLVLVLDALNQLDDGAGADLVRHFQQDGRRLAARGIEELPWQLAALRDWQRPWELLADLPLFDAAWQANEFEVRELWARLEAESSLRMVEAYRPVIDAPERQEAGYLGAVADQLQTTSHPSERAGRLHPLLVDKVADLLQTTGHLTEARILRGHVIEHYRDADEGSYAAALGNQALILKDQGDLEGAMRLLQQVEEICRRLNDPNSVAISLINQAELQGIDKGQPRQALPQAEEAHRLATRHGLIALAEQIQPILDEIRKRAGT